MHRAPFDQFSALILSFSVIRTRLFHVKTRINTSAAPLFQDRLFSWFEAIAISVIVAPPLLGMHLVLWHKVGEWGREAAERALLVLTNLLEDSGGPAPWNAPLNLKGVAETGMTFALLVSLVVVPQIIRYCPILAARTVRLIGVAFLVPNFISATRALRSPLERLLRDDFDAWIFAGSFTTPVLLCWAAIALTFCTYELEWEAESRIAERGGDRRKADWLRFFRRSGGPEPWQIGHAALALVILGPSSIVFLGDLVPRIRRMEYSMNVSITVPAAGQPPSSPDVIVKADGSWILSRGLQPRTSKSQPKAARQVAVRVHSQVTQQRLIDALGEIRSQGFVPVLLLDDRPGDPP